MTRAFVISMFFPMIWPPTTLWESTMKKPEDLTTALFELGLRHTANNFDDIVALATKKRWALAAALEHICRLEHADRAQRSQERRLRRSKLGHFKPVADFDWAWPKTIDRAAVEAALTLEFLERAGNVVFVAPQGLGKTMLAQNIAYEAVIAGHTARFVTASELLLDLAAQESARTLERRLRFWSSIKLLVIDEIGYLSYDNRNADLLFQVVSRRYEKKSLVLTTNLPFKQWSTVFPNAACTTALIDRIIHHAEVIAIAGDSYRLREADAKTRSRREKRPHR